jgi:TPR repeat protein
MYFFSITLIAGTAAAVLFLLSAIYSSVTGVPYFLDSEIPAAVFLGLHLLVTDPSTSPRTPLGKAIFGALYGGGVFVLYWLLTSMGAPTFYDKLLCVPLLNLSVQWIDRAANSLSSRIQSMPGFLSLNPVHIAAWAVLFVTMTALGRTDGKHTGDSVPFWQQACSEGRANGCKRLLQLETTYCGDNSAWACNELGTHYREGKLVAANAELAQKHFAKACELRLQAACVNLLRPREIRHEQPHELDLRLLLREGGQNLMQMSGTDLYRRACDHGWTFACERAAGAR